MSNTNQNQAGERTQFKKGDRVEIHSYTIGGRPIIEGKATILGPASVKVDNYYRVRFDGDCKSDTFDRFVMPEHREAQS